MPHMLCHWEYLLCSELLGNIAGAPAWEVESPDNSLVAAAGNGNKRQLHEFLPEQSNILFGESQSTLTITNITK